MNHDYKGIAAFCSIKLLQKAFSQHRTTLRTVSCGGVCKTNGNSVES